MAMTEGLILLAFLILPCLIVWAAAIWLLPGRTAGSVQLQTGIALIFGPLLTAPALQLSHSIGLPLSPVAAIVSLTLVALVLLIPAWLISRSNWAGMPENQATPPTPILISPRLDRALLVFLLALILVRIASILPDLLLRPVFPWDAWKTWVFKARAWFETGEILSFVRSSEWLTAPADTQTIEGTNHPNTLSLVILWSAIALGRWDDSLLGLPWLLCSVGMLLCIYGALRLQRVPPALALLGPYLTLSLPIVTTHTALYGYADLWMAGLFTTLAAGILLWQKRRGTESLILIGASLASMMFIKDTGSYWVPVVLAALLAMALPDRWLVRAAVTGAAAGVLLLLLGVDPMALITQSRFQLDPREQAAVWSGMARHLFVWLDWHLLGYLLPLIVLGAIWTARKSQPVRSVLILLLACLAALLLAFALTRAGQYAIIGTLFSRMFLHLVPVIVILSVLMVWEWKRRTGRQQVV